jgi:hypothetical protein
LVPLVLPGFVRFYCVRAVARQAPAASLRRFRLDSPNSREIRHENRHCRRIGPHGPHAD